jgi:AcrR family transcriptional regulator
MDDQAASDVPLRQDAARNLLKILAAARASFYQEGLDVGVEAIAQRAGVGVGTLYRRFPTKDSLIDAVVDELLREVLDVASATLANEPPATGIAEFLRAVGQVQAEHAGCLARLWSDTARRPVRAEIETIARTLLSRAQQAGSVRMDVTYEDIVLLHWSIRGVIETTFSVAPDAWLRHLDLLLAGLAPSAQSFRHPPVSTAQVEAVQMEVSVRLREAPVGSSRPA